MTEKALRNKSFERLGNIVEEKQLSILQRLHVLLNSLLLSDSLYLTSTESTLLLQSTSRRLFCYIFVFGILSHFYFLEKTLMCEF